MSNWSIIGNSERLAELARDLNEDQLAHAYLLAGPAEVGKFTAAKEFARLILCESKSACGECTICKQMRSNVYPGLTIVDQLWIEGSAEDWEEIGKRSNFPQLHRSKTPKAKTDVISISDMRAIYERLHTVHDTTQVIIIRNVERLNREAANSFLKTLEEPPPRTVFLLTTGNLPLLPATLVSRCRLIQFANVANEAIETHLQAEFSQLSEVERDRIVNFALGKPGRAVKLAADPEQLAEYAEYFRQLKELFGKPELAARFQFAEAVSSSATATAKFLEALNYFLRSFLLTRVRTPVADSRYNLAKITALLRATDQARDLISRNVNSRLVVENLLLTF